MPEPLRSINSWIVNRERWGIILIFLIFFILRFYRLGYHDLWYDEAHTAQFSRSLWIGWNAPLYWIMLHFWTKISGVSEFSLRFPSFLFSFFSLIFIFLLGKALFNKKIAVISSIIMGLSPLHLWYAQEARDYSMVLFFATLSSYLLIKAVKEKQSKLWIFFTLTSIIGFYTSYFYILLFLAQCIYILFLKRSKISFKEIIYFLLIMAAFLPYLPRFLDKFYYVSQGFWVPKPTWQSLVITFENFILGYNGSYSLYIISDILAAVFFVYAIWAGRKPELKKSLIFCLTLCFIPILLAFFFSRKFFSIYLDRGLIIFSPYFYLILGLGIYYLDRILRVILSILLISIMLVADFRYFNDFMFKPLKHHLGTYIKNPIKPIVVFLNENLNPEEDILAFTNLSTQPSINFYSGGKLNRFYYFFDPRFLDTDWQRPIQESRFNVPFYKINQISFKRCWVIVSDWERNVRLDENSRSVKAWLDKNLKLEFSRSIQGLRLFRYAKD